MIHNFVRFDKTKKDRSLIEDFYKKNKNEYVVFSENETIDSNGYEYYGIIEDASGKIIAITSIESESDNVAKMWSTVVKEDIRGRGIGALLNIKIEKEMKSNGYGKLYSHIYVDNLASIILKLKLGWIIEGTLRDHDRIGQHEYVLGKILE